MERPRHPVLPSCLEFRLRNRHLLPRGLVAVELSNTTASRILVLEAPERTVGNPNVKLAIGIVSMLGAFPLFFPFVTRHLAIMLFLGGLVVYCSGISCGMSGESERDAETKKQFLKNLLSDLPC